MAETLVEPQRETPVAGRFDVAVAGGGTAGVIAAVAAARNGARVVLLERGGFLGGHIATQLLEHSAGWFDAGGNRIVGGLPDDLVDRLKKHGATQGHVRDDTGYTLYRLPISHEEFKSVVTGWLDAEGVTIRVHAPVVALAATNGGAQAVVTETKGGRQAYVVHAVVDATGDADVCAAAQCRFWSEPGQETQPTSLLFKLGGVDHGALLDYVAAHPDQFKLGVSADALRERDFINLWGFGALLRRAHGAGELSLLRNELHYSGWTLTGEASINATRCAADATKAEDLARAEVVLRRQVLEFLSFFRKYVPGCANVFLSATASCVGIRESRRILGRDILSDEDVRQGRARADAIARGGFPIDSHDPKGASMDAAEHVPSGYDIPLGALLPADHGRIIVAGRSISAERRALASARITGTCMAMGQAAGTAAALAARAGVTMEQLSVADLQRVLRAQGALFAGP